MSTIQVTRGILVECDPAIKQFILHLDQVHSFVLKDLDETHLMVDASVGTLIEEELDKLADKNTFVPIEGKD
jgi:TFIIH basal transcription factor complex TTD-A subunit